MFISSPRYTPAYRKEQIIAAAIELFETQGYQNTKMQDIAKKAKISTGLIYRYFNNKQALFAACTMHQSIQQAQGLPSSRAEDKAPLIRYHNLVQRLLLFSLSHTYYERRQKEPLLAAMRRDDLAEQMVQPFEQILKDGNHSGDFKCQDPEVAARLLAYAIIHCIPPAQIPDQKELARYLENIYRLMGNLVG